jgi:FtsP/CotA-like multicopper oxidase with cupredoxin domain
VDPREDDPFLQINANGDSHLYRYEISADHAIGTFWYHSHIHPGVNLQVSGGLYGALIVEPNAETLQYAAGNDPDAEEFLQFWRTFSKISKYTALVSWFYPIATENCTCPDGDDMQHGMHWTTSFGEDMIDEPFRPHSQCYIWCTGDAHDREKSGLPYEVECEGDNTCDREYFLVNGVARPQIIVKSLLDYTIIRMVNAMNGYFSYTFWDDFDEAYVIALDGVFVEDAPRELLNDNRWPGQLLIPPGGRADVLVRCGVKNPVCYVKMKDEIEDPWQRVNNEVRVNPSNGALLSVVPLGEKRRGGKDSRDDSKWEEMYSMFGVERNKDMFKEPRKSRAIITAYPTPSESIYPNLRKLRNFNDMIDECGCHAYNSNFFPQYSEDRCFFVLSSRALPGADHSATINALEFEAHTPMIELNLVKNITDPERETSGIYEFEIRSGGHPFHQHTFHFQLRFDAGDGLVGRAGDYRDTVGGGLFRMRFDARNFHDDQRLFLHCHLLSHGDHGMTTWLQLKQVEHEDDIVCDLDKKSAFDV